MSQLAPVRPLPRTSPRRATTTPRQLKVVTPSQVQGNGVFLALCVALLLGGFVAVLMLNTAMAKGSYTMRDLQRRSDALADTQDALRHTIDGVSGPGPLAQRARDLGMVPASSAAFLRLSDGKVLGVAEKAKQDSTFSVVTESSAPTRSTPVATAPAPPTATPGATSGTPQGPGTTAATGTAAKGATGATGVTGVTGVTGATTRTTTTKVTTAKGTTTTTTTTTKQGTTTTTVTTTKQGTTTSSPTSTKGTGAKRPAADPAPAP